MNDDPQQAITCNDEGLCRMLFSVTIDGRTERVPLNYGDWNATRPPTALPDTGTAHAGSRRVDRLACFDALADRAFNAGIGHRLFLRVTNRCPDRSGIHRRRHERKCRTL